MSETGIDAPAVLVDECEPGIVTVTLNRPAARNALNFESWAGLSTALEDARRRDDTRAVVITGSAGFFSAGGDLKTPPRAGTRAIAPVARMESAHRVLRMIRELPIPVIAAVEGRAIGMGWSLVLACDLVVAARNARFSAPFVARAVVPDGGAGWFLTRRLGRHRAASVLLTGADLEADHAHGLGLVTHLAEPGAALAAARDLAREIAAASPHAVELTKRMLEQAEQTDLPQYLALELTSGALSQLGPDAESARRLGLPASGRPSTDPNGRA